MEIYIGTSGWLYSWNPKLNFDWYMEYSGLNSVELNASFYRFPFPNQVKGWCRKGKSLRWIVKVNRLITHTFKFNDKALNLWEKFKALFEPLDGNIDFYLFQLPPSMKSNFMFRLEGFIRKTNLDGRFALEVRNMDWFRYECINWAEKLGITWVSVDCPDLPSNIYCVNGIVYERMHGRSDWYSHDYSEDELLEIAKGIIELNPKKVYIMFNNDHAMLSNARTMKRILEEMV